jgi:hypothetical protein
MEKKTIRVVACCTLLVLLTGCGLTAKQMAKTQAFGDATSRVGKFGEVEFVNIRNGIIEMNQAIAVIDQSQTLGDLVLDRPAYAEPTARRVAASKALTRYGELLVKLASDDRSENLQVLGTALADNTSQALGQDLSDQKQEDIGDALGDIGSIWLDRRKARAIRRIVPVYQQPVDQLADLLAADFSIDDGAVGYLQAYRITAKRLHNLAGNMLNAGEQISLLERDWALQAYVLSEKALQRSMELSREAGKVLQGLKRANVELARLVEDPEYSRDDLKNYAKQVKAFANLYQALAD